MDDVPCVALLCHVSVQHGTSSVKCVVSMLCELSHMGQGFFGLYRSCVGSPCTLTQVNVSVVAGLAAEVQAVAGGMNRFLVHVFWGCW